MLRLSIFKILIWGHFFDGQTDSNITYFSVLENTFSTILNQYKSYYKPIEQQILSIS